MRRAIDQHSAAEEAFLKIKLHVSGILVIFASILIDGGEVIAFFFLAALIHEFGHLLGARVMKKRVDRIEIGFSGARIVIEDRMLGYGEEFFIAFMGPFFNFLTVGAVFLAFMHCGGNMTALLESGMRFLEDRAGNTAELVGFLAISALSQAILNLLPIKSLDGGRMLYSCISAFFGERAGERVTGISTLFFAVAAWLVALYLMIRVEAGLALFVFAVWGFFLVTEKSGKG